ncbi:tripartite tricarboxylate transporter substrate binding protein [Hydrogenophaga sp.]|uniref:Bug family tripartite tricarboxylate transporter substrate binding protein n=1 Tax=Hydrogenophaga sp. TaxID=1904254 RepID=UPI0027220091|nr:tripartite tricarboxylate transporter substrate binding protein [Hydrogenophaga sp.]MDO9436189.1 tripartite tricarboxylate transporter substrate binding protein [Hydrogenophaga sp.]
MNLKTLAAATMLALTMSAPAWSQAAFPSTAIKVVVPSAPGGLSDPVVRFLGEHLQRELGQPVIMVHRPGGGGLIGTQQVTKAVPDGHTLLLGNIGPLVFAPAMMPKPPYVVQRDLTPVGSLLTFGNAVLVNPAVQATTIAQLIAVAKQNPGTINFASAGNGQSQHLTGELFKRVAGIDIMHVPYKGTGPATTDLIGGQVQLMFGNIPAALPFIKSGQLRVIAVTSPRRSAALPGVPTVEESGLPGFAVVSWVALMAPAGTPKPVIDRLNEAVDRAWATPDGQKLLASLNFDWVKTSPAELSSFLDGEITKWTKLIKDADIKGE